MTYRTSVSSDIDGLANEFLTAIEAREAGLMNWGFYAPEIDMAVEFDELLATLTQDATRQWKAAQLAGLTVDDLVDNLLERSLLFRTGNGHRTRFAEGIRLLATLRQLFPQKSWVSSPKLVADLRVDVRRRRYPARDVPGADVLVKLREVRVPVATVSGMEQLLKTGNSELMTVAAFQARAAHEILRHLGQRRDTGIVIGAGTGSGKTKAFYTPAFAHVAANLSNERHVQAIAIYPRIELLKDQIQEAYTEARKLDDLQRARGKRPVTLGAYYGDTPFSAQWLKTELESRRRGYKQAPPDWICPYAKCPTPDCNGAQLVWRFTDVERAAAEEARSADAAGKAPRHERLVCKTCEFTVDGSTLQLTRSRMAAHPPDLLFTTTEMLNRKLMAGGDMELFGIGAARPPRLLLLDEIHAYEGLFGAQNAYLLRRWRHARGRRSDLGLCVVGLSATLASAEDFFARLTGLSRNEITYISPRTEELIDEGAEYNVAVKGNPVNRTNLLSTSIQTAMLIGRILDPMDTSVPSSESLSRGAFGRRTFAFTDQLDVVNRWYHYELSAETTQRLAHLRSTNPVIRASQPGPGNRRRPSVGAPRYSETDEAARQADGQLWGVPETIGHDLTQALTVGLVSSQSQLSGQSTDLVIATSALEVGFNDEEVGAVLQHKAPRSVASFLQRKGRAGRPRTMRPWTIIVTSSYGRDRWAFQHAEEVFQPSLRSIDLPTENIYIQKIHATFALMDWLAWELKRLHVDVDLWSLLKGGSGYGDYKVGRVLQLVEAVLNDTRRAALERYLEGALGLSKEDLEQVMWGDPRSLMLEVLPTMARQLETKWGKLVLDPVTGRLVSGGPGTDRIGAGPLPDFVPQNLFTDLNLPELLLTFPGTDDESQTMSLLQGMVEFAPGRVSKRFAKKDDEQSAHWVPPPDPALDADVATLSDLVKLDSAPRVINLDGDRVHLYRPTEYLLEQVPNDILPSSSARLLWQSSLRAVMRPGGSNIAATEVGNPGTTMVLPDDSPWATLITGIRGYEHRHSGAVEVVRAATGVVVETRRQSRGAGGVKDDARRRYRFESAEGTAAIGFVVTCDGIGFDFQPLDVEKLVTSDAWQHIRVDLAPECFKAALLEHELIIKADLSSFEVDWIWQLELSMLTAGAIVLGTTLEAAAADLDRSRTAYARRALTAMFQAQPVSPNAENDGGNPDPEGDAVEDGRLQARLMELQEDEDVVAALRATRSLMWRDDDRFLRPWLVRCYAASLGAAIFTALLRFVPDLDPETLSLDVGDERIWVTETTGGGVGHVVKLNRAIRSRPRALSLLLDDVTRHCDREAVAVGLERVADILAKSDGPLARAVADVREQGNLRRQDATRQALVRALEADGIPVTRELVVNLNAKMLRAHTNVASDTLVGRLVDRWRAEEARLGCAIDLRFFAVAASRIPELINPILELLEGIGSEGATDREAQIFNVLQSMLWLSCPTSCEDCIEQRNPYGERPKASRALVRFQLPYSLPPVRFGVDGWEETIRKRLSSGFAGSVIATHSEIATLTSVLFGMLTTPVETEFQVLYPAIERIVRDGQDWVVSLVIRELSAA